MDKSQAPRGNQDLQYYDNFMRGEENT